MNHRHVRRHKERRYVRNDTDRRPDFALFRHTANVASQPSVGLLSQWRAWLDPFDFDHPLTARTPLGGRSMGQSDVLAFTRCYGETHGFGKRRGGRANGHQKEGWMKKGSAGSG